MVGFLSTCKHSTSSSTMYHVIIHYTPCHHPPNHIFMSLIDFLWLITCISQHEFTNEYCHVISLVSLLSHFTLKFCLKNSRSNARGSVSLSSILFFTSSSLVARDQCAGAVGTRDAWGRPGLLGGQKCNGSMDGGRRGNKLQAHTHAARRRAGPGICACACFCRAGWIVGASKRHPWKDPAHTHTTPTLPGRTLAS
jgi:hypothetical protein